MLQQYPGFPEVLQANRIGKLHLTELAKKLSEHKEAQSHLCWAYTQEEQPVSAWGELLMLVPVIAWSATLQ